MTDPDTYVPHRPPAGLLLAAASPTLVLALLEVLRELGGWAPPLEAPALALVWLSTTLPPVLVLLGLRGRQGAQALPEVERALEAVARAEQLARASVQAHAQVQALLQERAAERAAAAGGRPAGDTRRAAVAAAGLTAVFFVVAGGFALAFLAAPVPPKPVHIHPALAVFVDGQRVDYSDPHFDLAQRGVLRAHLHVQDGFPGIVHVEGLPGVTLGEVVNWSLDGRLAEDALTLDQAVHGGAIHTEYATHRVRLFVAPQGSEAWGEVKPVATYVPRDHDRLLLSFGASWGAALDAEKAAVPTRFP